MWSVYLVNAHIVIQITTMYVVYHVVCLLNECPFFQMDHILRTSDVINLTGLIKGGPIYLVTALNGQLRVFVG
jgi:hypothetical protein